LFGDFDGKVTEKFDLKNQQVTFILLGEWVGPVRHLQSAVLGYCELFDLCIWNLRMVQNKRIT
jgi:hypothetical protein